MDYLKIKRNLENYTVRNIPKRLITVNASGDTVFNTSSPNYYYGQIPEYKIDKEGFFILDSAGEKIPNTIDINIFITQEYDDMGIFTDMDFIPKQPPLSQPPNNSPLWNNCGNGGQSLTLGNVALTSGFSNMSI